MQMKGLSQDAARSRISMFDIDGLLEQSRVELSESQKVYAHKAQPSKDLVKTIETLKPTVLVGVSTKGGAFNQRAVETMSRLNERPIIFALSNPLLNRWLTSKEPVNWRSIMSVWSVSARWDTLLPSILSKTVIR